MHSLIPCAIIGSWQLSSKPMEVEAISPEFCPNCGSILDLPEIDNIMCTICDYHCKYGDLKCLNTITYSEKEPIPRWVLEGLQANDAQGPARATVEEACPKCEYPEMEYYTMQLRSADEGQTVFYECKNKSCGYKFSVNN